MYIYWKYKLEWSLQYTAALPLHGRCIGEVNAICVIDCFFVTLT